MTDSPSRPVAGRTPKPSAQLGLDIGPVSKPSPTAPATRPTEPAPPGLSTDPSLQRAQLAHTLLRQQPRAEVESLVRWTLDVSDEKDPSTQIVDHFHGVLARHLGEVVRQLGEMPSTVAEATAFEQGMPRATARLVAYLENFGPKGREVSDGLRSKSTSDDPWGVWIGRSPNKPSSYALRALAVAVWSDEVQPRLASSRPLQSGGVRLGVDHYTPMPKVMSPMSWALGAPGVDAMSVVSVARGGVEVDGDRYAREPHFIRDAAEVRSLVGAKLSRSYRLLPAGHERRPHHASLPLSEEGESLPMTVAGSNGFVLSAHAAKLALLLLASPQVKRGGLATATLRELAATIHAGAARLQARDNISTAHGLDELRNLFLYLPDDTKVQVFDVQSPRDPALARGDEVLRLGLTRVFCDVLGKADSSSGLRGPALTGSEYRGEFLVNLTGLMRLPNRQPALMRYYMRCAASWNAAFRQGGEFDPDKFRALPVEEWAAIANDLPEGVVEYLAARREGRPERGDKRRLSDARKAARDQFELLKEQGLIRLEEHGKLLKPLPTEAYLEAWSKIRMGGSRPGQADVDEE